MNTEKIMGVCPICKKEIEKLDAVMYPTVICSYDGSDYNFKNLSSDMRDFQMDVKDSLSHFCCPECGEEIAQTENEANGILHN